MEKATIRNAVLIAGCTASGKSALALELARRIGGVIVNADSMQVYDVLRVLTARPDDAALATAPHRLYGHVDPHDAYSTGRWLADVASLDLDRELSPPAIFVGGTGLYFRALLKGLSEMPEIPDDIRSRWRYRLAEEGPDRLHRVLMKQDPPAAMTIRAADGQRIVRALEVLEASGRSIRDWQAIPGAPLVDPSSAVRIVLDPSRDVLADRIATRFTSMVDAGASEEVRALLRLQPDPALPVTKAIGVREIGDMIDGKTSLEEAISRSVIATRQYAKRQSTFFRSQLSDAWQRLEGLVSPDREAERLAGEFGRIKN